MLSERRFVDMKGTINQYSDGIVTTKTRHANIIMNVNQLEGGATSGQEVPQYTELQMTGMFDASNALPSRRDGEVQEGGQGRRGAVSATARQPE